MRHRPAEGIDLAHQMSLANTADGWIATHLANRLDIVGQQKGASATARSRERRFGAGMAATDNDHFEILERDGRHGCKAFDSEAGF